MNKGIAIGLLIASLILLIIYGADVISATSSSSAGSVGKTRGFLPFSEAIRGGVFEGGAVLMSIIAFILSRKEFAPAVSLLLFINGFLIIAGMIVLIVQGALASEASTGAARTISSTISMGAILVGLGGWKVITDKKIISKKASAQK